MSTQNQIIGYATRSNTDQLDIRMKNDHLNCEKVCEEEEKKNELNSRLAKSFQGTGNVDQLATKLLCIQML